MKCRVFVVFLLLAGSVVAQLDAGTIIRRVRVRVTFEKGGCDLSTRVQLMGRSGPMIEAVTNDQCEVDFVSVPVGTYHVIVSGQNIPSTDSGSIEMDSTGANELEIKVKRNEDAGRTGGVAMSPFVSTADLAVPAKAQKEFDKANQLTTRQDVPGAIQRLNKAIAIYPSYAGAYNNLGVLYARQGDHERESEALQKAISINDHFAPAYVNLGRMSITAGDFPGAETALHKAATLDPADAMTLVLLTYAEFMNRHIDDVIVTSRRAHLLQGPHAFVHQVAARAFEQKRQGANAIAELQLFLKEEPNGERADIARKELKALQAIPH